MNQNYYKEFEKQIDSIAKEASKPKLLLQACCAPCSSACLEKLEKYFDIAVYFYNPNIDDREEYVKRLDELVRLTDEAEFAKEVKVIDGDWEPELFFEMAKGRESLPERGERCYDCYKLRMKKTAEFALKNGYDYFSTTLSISPYKNSEWINEIGMELESSMRQASPEDENTVPVFLFSDFKKKDGYKRSIQLSREYGLYRQNYCGCIFSRRDSSSETENS